MVLKTTFVIYENWNFNDFFVLLALDLRNGSENFKIQLLLQIAAKRFKACPEFSFQLIMVLTKPLWEFMKFWVPILTIFFFFKNFKFTIVPYGEKNPIFWKTEWNGVKFGTHGQ